MTRDELKEILVRNMGEAFSCGIKFAGDIASKDGDWLEEDETRAAIAISEIVLRCFTEIWLASGYELKKPLGN